MLRQWCSLLMAVLLLGVLDLTTATALNGMPSLQQLSCTGPAWEPPCGYYPKKEWQKSYIAKKPTWPPTAANKHGCKLQNREIINNSTFVASWLISRAERAGLSAELKEMHQTIKEQECIIQEQEESLKKLHRLTAECLQLGKSQDVRRLGNELLVAKIINLADLDDLLKQT